MNNLVGVCVMPTQGDAISAEAEDVFVTVLQSGAGADGPGTVADVGGLAGPVSIEVVNVGTGTSTVNLEGSFDGVNWYSCGYAQVDGQGTLVRSVTVIAVGASPFAHVYAVADTYTRLRARMSGTIAGASVTATLRGLPV